MCGTALRLATFMPCRSTRDRASRILYLVDGRFQASPSPRLGCLSALPTVLALVMVPVWLMALAPVLGRTSSVTPMQQCSPTFRGFEGRCFITPQPSLCLRDSRSETSDATP